MTDLSDDERTRLRGAIAAERARTQVRVAGLRRDFDEIVESSADAVRDDEHDPEGATIAFERAQVVALIDAGRAQLTALDRADRRLDGDDAGVCERCRGCIGVQRLLARPSATRCVKCAG